MRRIIYILCRQTCKNKGIDNLCAGCYCLSMEKENTYISNLIRGSVLMSIQTIKRAILLANSVGDDDKVAKLRAISVELDAIL